MAGTQETKFSLAKLNDGNYQPWKFKMRMLLIREGTWTVVNEPKPTTIPAEWTGKDEKAQTTISLCIEDNQIVHVCKCTSARDMWLELQKVHERANLSNKLYLLRKLYQTKLEEGQEMKDYIRGTLEMVECLRGIGEEIKDFHVAALLLGGLPDEYNALVTALDARPDDELTLEYVKGKLVDEFKRKNSSSSTINTNSNSALKVQNQHSKKKWEKGNVKETRECFTCKKIGHLKKDCSIWKARKRENDKQTGDHKANSAISDKYDNSRNHVCFKISTSMSSSDGWYVDSGASSHMTNDKNFFNRIYNQKTGTITVANGQQITSEAVGEGYLDCKVSSTNTTRIQIKDVLYAPELDASLLSVKRLLQEDFVVTFKGNGCIITRGETVSAVGMIEDDLFKLSCTERANMAKKINHHDCIHLWHRRLGHRDPEAIKKIERNNLAIGIKVNYCSAFVKCISCTKGKLTKKPFPKASMNRAKQTLDLIHTDVCGPMRIQTPGKKRYFLTFIDDYSRYTVIYLLHTKDEVAVKLEEYIAAVTNKFERKPKILRADNGGEYTGKKTQDILKKHGIEFQTTVPYSPQQNGIAERKNRTLTESAKCMLLDAALPTKYWGEAIVTAGYLQNRLPTKATERTPFEMWNGEKPDLQHIKVFGSKAYAYIPKEKRTKWDPRAQEGILVGYSECSKGYRILQLETEKITISRTAVIDEKPERSLEFIRPRSEQEQLDQLKEKGIIDKVETEDEVIITDDGKEKSPPSTSTIEKIPQSIRQSKRVNKGIPPKRLSFKAQVEPQPEPEPESWKDMMKIPKPERVKWIKAADEEIQSLKENQTWDLTELPTGKHAIGCKWIFKMKYNSEGRTDRYKARLVAKGYSQKYGEDYDCTFAPVVRQSTFRALMSVAAAEKMKVRHYDIKTAFLNGDIEEDLYMQQPEGYTKKHEEHLVCKLKKSIYGLKQSARAWNIKMNDVLIANRFKRSQSDPCLYSKKEDNKWIYVLVYVDDLIIAHKDEKVIKRLGVELNRHFKTKDLGDATYYLGIHIQREGDGSFLFNQSTKINGMLCKFGMEEAKGASTPMDTEYPKDHEENNLLPNNEKYRQAVGALLYIGTTTRPDIATAMGILSRRVSKPRQKDWDAVKRVMRYLKHTQGMKLRLSGTKGLDLTGYVDADWAGDTTDRKSTSGYIFKLGDSPISWSSRKQMSVALSSTEAEYVSAANATQEVLWLRQLMQDLGQNQVGATTIYEDNQGCIKLATSEKMSNRTKHIDVRHHHLRDLVERNVIQFEYCESEKMIADALTKPLPGPRLESLRAEMGVIP